MLNCGTYQYAAITAAIDRPMIAFRGFFLAAQKAGNAIKITNVHLVSIPNPLQMPNAIDHLELEKSLDSISVHSDIATIAVSQYSSIVSRDSQTRNGMKLTITAASVAAPGSIKCLATPYVASASRITAGRLASCAASIVVPSNA